MRGAFKKLFQKVEKSKGLKCVYLSFADLGYIINIVKI